MRGVWSFLCCLALGACAAAAPLQAHQDGPPQRIVSLDYCADQFALGLADRSQIVALSPHAQDDYAYLRDEAAGVRQTPPTLEAVMALEPDLVIRTYGGGMAIGAQLERLGVPVVQLDFAEDYLSIAGNIQKAAQAFGHGARGEALAGAMLSALAEPAAPRGLRALYVTPGGVTSGRGSMIDALMTSAGLTNYVEGPGWPALPLEQLALDPPDVIITSFYGSAYARLDSWSSAQHPVLQRLLAQRPVIALDAALVSCNGWFVAEAVQRLRGAP
jgi:iron complex transport system substrate-binding protein